MTNIREILSRRYDLSTFIVHLTRDFDGKIAEENLRSILKSKTVKARTPMGIARYWVKEHSNAEASQKAVSFSEAPLDQLWSFIQELDPPRKVQFSKFGIVFPRLVARRLDLNPIWYIDKTPGTTWLHGRKGSSSPLNRLIEKIDQDDFSASPISHLTPFIDPMGTWGESKREFSWEREWRKVGDLNFKPSDLAFGLAPEDKIEELEKWVNRLTSYKERKYPVRFVDPTWGLEEILAILSGIERSDFSPF
jgi:hypothetical protein